MAKPRCVQYIATKTGCRQCKHTATHFLPSNPNTTTCSQHARTYDVPMSKESK